jgi:hypothetical protein
MLTGVLLLWVDAATTSQVILTGWFSDESCAKGRVEAGRIGPTNPDCAKKCLEKGAAPVFISEQGKELLRVNGSFDVRKDLGYHIELTGQLNAASKTISIQQVKRIGGYVGPACTRPQAISASKN